MEQKLTEAFEFSINVFTEFAELSDTNIVIKRVPGYYHDFWKTKRGSDPNSCFSRLPDSLN